MRRTLMGKLISLTNNPMTNWLNEKSFSHLCHYGTYFEAARCDFRDGVKVTNAPKMPDRLASDVAEMATYHALNIHPQLNGFQGYDCIWFDFVKKS